MIAHLLFILSNVALAVFGWRVACGLASRESLRARIFIATAAYGLGILTVLLIAGMCGQLRAVPVAVGACLLASLAWWITRSHRTAARAISAGDDPQFRALGSALLAALGTVAVLKVLTGGTQFFSDDLGYHAVAVNAWLREGRFGLIAPAFTSYYPFNSELFSLWFSLPYGHDAWAGLAGPFWLLVALLGIGVAAEIMRLRPSAGALAACMVLASHQVWWIVRTFSAADLAVGAACFAAVIFTARAAHAPECRLGWAAFAGGLAGLTLGMKVTAAPVLAVLGICLLIRPRGLALFLAFCGAAFATGAYWFLWNWTTTGNPVFPGEAGPFAGPFTKALQSEGRLITHLLAHWSSPSFWPSIIRGYLDWPFGLGVFALLGYGSALLAERRARDEPPDARTLRRLLLSCGLLLLAVHPFLPFSWGAGYVNGALIPFPRYVIASFIPGMALCVRLFDGAHPRAFFWRAAAIVAVLTCWPGPGGAVTVAVLAALLLPPLWQIAGPRVALAIAGLLLLAGIPALTSRQLAATDRNLAGFGRDEGKPIGAGWAALEKLPAGSRVTSFTHFDYHVSPLSGRRLQLVPILVAPDGTPARPLHELFRENRNPGMRLEYTGTSGPALAANLRAAGVEFVFISRYPEETWPPQYAPLRDTALPVEIYRDDFSVIWRLPPTP